MGEGEGWPVFKLLTFEYLFMHALNSPSKKFFLWGYFIFRYVATFLQAEMNLKRREEFCKK